jgi:hypothetical protein
MAEHVDIVFDGPLGPEATGSSRSRTPAAGASPSVSGSSARTDAGSFASLRRTFRSHGAS